MCVGLIIVTFWFLFVVVTFIRFVFDFKISYFIMRHVTPLWCSTLLFFVSHFSVCLNESLSYIGTTIGIQCREQLGI